jgi:aryl-alcohol dehydrogenase-like predicted oxidoreductase
MHPSAIALQYVLQNPSISAAVVGIRTKKHLIDALAAIEAPTMAENIYRQLNDISPANFYSDHR